MISREFFGIGCRVGIESLGGERGDVVGFSNRGVIVSLATGETIHVRESEIWRQSDPARPWGHDGWIPFAYTCMTWDVATRAVAIAGIEICGCGYARWT